MLESVRYLAISKRYAILVFREFLNGPAFAENKSQMTMLCNDRNKHEGTTTSFIVVVIDHLRRYATNPTVPRSNKKIRHSKQGLLMTWASLEKVSCSIVLRGSELNNQALGGFFVEINDLSVHKNTSR